MKGNVGSLRDYWLILILGCTLVVLIILLGVSFFQTIINLQIQSKKELLFKQVQLAGSELESEMLRFQDNAQQVLSYVEDEDLDGDDYRQDFTKVVRQLFINYPNLIDTAYVTMGDSTLYFTMTDRNDFIRRKFSFPVPNAQKYSYSIKSINSKFEVRFALDLVEFTAGFASQYYLNSDGGKLLKLGKEIEDLEPNSGWEDMNLDDNSYAAIKQDEAMGVMGVYKVHWIRDGKTSKGIMVQYPFDFGDIFEDASFMFIIETQSITSGVYATYIGLFIGLLFLLILTIFLFTVFVRNRQRSQKLLEENAKEISHLFDQQNLLLKELKGFVFFHNYKGEITRVSDEVEVVLGHPVEEFLAAFASKYVQIDAAMIRKKVKAAVENKKSFIDVEVNFTKPTKEKVRLRIFGKLVFENGRYNGGFGICTDITVPYQRQLDLVESGNRLQNLIDNIPDIIFIYSNTGKILRTHVRTTKSQEVESKLYIGKFLRDIIPLSDKRKILKTFYKARNSKQIQTLDQDILVDGELKHFEVRYFPLDEDTMMSISKDITTQRIWEKGLIEAKNAADNANRAKSEFLANMSHEIRTPMNGLLGIIDLLELTTLDVTQHQYVEIVKNSGNSLLSIIKDILDYSKIEAGRITIDSISFRPSEQINKQVQLFLALAKSKEIDVTKTCGPGTEQWMEGDAGKINQVVINLLGNAFKFTPIGGQVSIDLKMEQLTGELYYLICQVRDSGIGVSQEEIPMLTNPFYQVESSNSRSFQGTGLGLAIAKKMIGVMGGELTITSQIGEGSVFQFTVLVRKSRTDIVEPVEHLISERYNWKGMSKEFPLRILLAEDNKLNQELMSLILDQLGYEFTLAKNGEKALQLARDIDYDIVLMDVQMPKLNGLEATIAIRELNYRKDLIIIGLSANVFDEDHNKAIESGMDDYLTKPIRLNVLAEKLKFYAERMVKK
jgi:signal transduction histidine kinase/ActR/RegA family two-component response regulator